MVHERDLGSALFALLVHASLELGKSGKPAVEGETVSVQALGEAFMNVPDTTKTASLPPPAIEVSLVYRGANAESVADVVAPPIEHQLTGLEDMKSMTSHCGDDGTYTLTLTFDPGTDLDIAKVLVENRVRLAMPVLPEIVQRRGMKAKKITPPIPMITGLPERAKQYPRTSAGYLLPFEVVSVHLLVVLIGAAYLARAKRRRPITAKGAAS